MTAKEIIAVGNYMVESEDTVRGAAAKFGISKSTIHENIQKRLKDFDLELYIKVRKVLDKNKAEAHIRGGKVTGEMISKRKLNKEKSDE